MALGVPANIAVGTVKEDDAPEYTQRLREIAERLTALDEQELRAEDALVEGLGDARRMKARLEAIRAERLELREQQARAEADRVGGNVFRTIEKMREVILPMLADWDDSPEATPIEQWAVEEVAKAWNAITGEDQQALIRGRFTVTVRTGGRGAERVSVLPR